MHLFKFKKCQFKKTVHYNLTVIYYNYKIAKRLGGNTLKCNPLSVNPSTISSETLVILELDLNYVKSLEFVVKSNIYAEKCTNLKCTA